ncbi:hypothetical protein ACFWCB_18305 [Streptomyces sp. NPDC060048]|uniref:hypothetical protein n=1 Tax=unclassified Streptomyces TaxID=2593676 RepID=UPI0036BEC740
MATVIREHREYREPSHPCTVRELRAWRGWTGAAPFWLNSLLLLLASFTGTPLLAQFGIIAGLAALGGLARHVWSGDYGHPAIHTAAALMGAAAVVLVVV